MRRKIMINVYVEPDQKTALEMISAETGAAVSFLIRKAINEYLRSYKFEDWKPVPDMEDLPE